jgi:hypothetical protein
MLNGKKLSPVEKEAMMKVCQQIMDDMDDMMSDSLKPAKGMAKVSVAASSPEGLKEGLESAEEVVDGEAGEEEMESEDDGEPLGASPLKGLYNHAMAEEESEEELDAKIAELMAKKAALKG